MELVIGIIGFFLLYIYEVNQILWHKSFLKVLFLLGFFLIITSTLLTIIDGSNVINSLGSLFWFGVIFLTVFFILLIYTLFFSIPFTTSYIEQFQKRCVYTKKMYALSRHPGVLWFIGVYVSFVIISPTQSMVVLALVLVTLNVIYVSIQDIWSFPKLFVDYQEYKKKTPFLIPTLKSIFKTIHSYQGR